MKIVKKRSLALLIGLSCLYFSVNGQSKLDSNHSVSHHPAKVDWLQAGLSTNELQLMNADPGIRYMAMQEQETSVRRVNLSIIFARKLAEAGNILLAFDAPYQGESGDEFCFLKDRTVWIEGFRAATNYLGNHPSIDSAIREKILIVLLY
jgi:hypothetical protein